LRASRILILVVLVSGFIEPLPQLADASLTQARLEGNRFNLRHAQLAHASFLQLDADMSGTLSREELNRQISPLASQLHIIFNLNSSALLTRLISCLTNGLSSESQSTSQQTHY
uniref:EF-hand domain-containing protein n=1 Tax=Rodentolepis nana TaxID=102285 RepID=A0A0R3TFL5_RODNA